MTNFAWIKLLLRAIGVLLIGLGLPDTLGHVGSIIWWFKSTMALPDYLTPYLLSLVGSLTQMAFGTYLLLGGERITKLCLRDLDRVCLHCGYDVAAVKADRCPECGTQIRVGPERPVAAEAAQSPPAP